MKYFIISQPKAGTYLCGNLLKCFKITSSNLHLSETVYQKYPENYVKKGKPTEFTHKESLSESIKLVQDSEYAVGHIPYSEANNGYFTGFKKILLTRDIDSIKQSLERFKKEANRPYLKFNKRELEKIYSWHNQPDVFHITFEELINKDLNKIDLMQKYLFNEIRYNSEQCIDAAIKMDSMTKSSVRK